jgi:hypothetical protein
MATVVQQIHKNSFRGKLALKMVQEVWLFIGTSRYWLLDAFFKAGDELLPWTTYTVVPIECLLKYTSIPVLCFIVDMNNLDNVTAVLNEKQNDLGRNTY